MFKTNKELIQVNVDLLEQLNLLRNEKLQLERELLENKLSETRQNRVQLKLLQYVQSESEKAQNLIKQSQTIFNEMMESVSKTIVSLGTSCDKDSVDHLDASREGSDEKSKYSHYMTESERAISRQESFERIGRDFQATHPDLSIVEEAEEEDPKITEERVENDKENKRRSTFSISSAERTVRSTNSFFNNAVTPTSVVGNNNKSTPLVDGYEITPRFEFESFATPSIYNFDPVQVESESDASSTKSTPNTQIITGGMRRSILFSQQLAKQYNSEASPDTPQALKKVKKRGRKPTTKISQVPPKASSKLRDLEKNECELSDTSHYPMTEASYTSISTNLSNTTIDNQENLADNSFCNSNSMRSGRSMRSTRKPVSYKETHLTKK